MAFWSETFNLLRVSGTSQIGHLVVQQFDRIKLSCRFGLCSGLFIFRDRLCPASSCPLAATAASCSITFISTHSEKSQRQIKQIGQFNNQSNTNSPAGCPLNEAWCNFHAQLESPQLEKYGLISKEHKVTWRCHRAKPGWRGLCSSKMTGRSSLRIYRDRHRLASSKKNPTDSDVLFLSKTPHSFNLYYNVQ